MASDRLSPYLARTGSGRASSRPSSGTPTKSGPGDQHGSSSSSATEQQLAVLKQRHSQLEAEARSAVEASAWSLQQNKTTLNTLKAEAKELKAQLAARRGGSAGASTSGRHDSAGSSGPSTGGGGSVDRLISRLESEVHDARRNYDRIMTDKRTTLSRLENLQDAVRELARSGTAPGAAPAAAGGSNGSQPLSPAGSAASVGTSASGAAASATAQRQLRQLENRLEKASVKANEAQSIQRTYEQLLDKMRKEQLGHDAAMRELEAAIKARTAEAESVRIQGREAQYNKELAFKELSTFEAQLTIVRAKREKDMEVQRSQARVVQSTNEALLKHQLSDPALAAAVLGGGNSVPVIPKVEVQPVGSAAEAARLLCEALGISVEAPDAGKRLQEKLLPQQETFDNLERMRALAGQQLRELEADVAQAREHVADLHSGGQLSTQAQLDAAQAELKEAAAHAERAREEHDKVQQAYVSVRSGIEHLVHMVGPLPLPPGQSAVVAADEEAMGEALAQCQARLQAALKLIQALPKAAQLLQGMVDNPDYAFAPASAGGASAEEEQQQQQGEEASG